jgi:hypothetical protein
MQEGLALHKVPMLLGHERRYWEQNRGLHNIWLLSIYVCLVIFDKGLGLGGEIPEIQQMQPEFSCILLMSICMDITQISLCGNRYDLQVAPVVGLQI